MKEIREDRDLLQRDVAKLLCIPTRTYSSYETEDRGLPLDILKKLAVIYNTSSDYIIYLTDERRAYPKSIINE